MTKNKINETCLDFFRQTCGKNMRFEIVETDKKVLFKSKHVKNFANI